MARRATLAAQVVLLLVAACGDGSRVYKARGVVRDIHAEYGQVTIEHDDIPGLMSAMTMNFDVPNPELLASMKKGQPIEFEIEFTGKSYRVIRSSPREGDFSAGGAARASLPTSARLAPEFTLVDQHGAAASLASLRGKAVVLDFVFTHCPGPCPILTGIQVDLQRMLPPDLRARSHFVSISLDPQRDTPERLREYARARGADLAGWSFLTGEVDRVDAVVKAYGVGRVRTPEGQVDHTVATFLIDPDGRIAEMYLGLDHEPEEILQDLARVLP